MSNNKWSKALSNLRKKPEMLDEVNDEINKIMEMVRSGYDLKKVRSVFKSQYPLDLLYEVSKSRIKVKDKFSKADQLWLDDYSASYSTPEIIGHYRSSRIGGRKIIDIGSGAGMQSIMFAFNNDVTAIEVRSERIEMARLNAMVYGVRNIKFIHGDYAAIIENMDISEESVIFSDPLRPRAETERTLDSLIPSPKVIMKLSEKFTNNFAFDLPPQIRWSEITIPGEREYVSVDGKLNRLTVYTGDLKKSEVSAVILPEEIVLRGEAEDFRFEDASEPRKYLYLVDPAVTYARLLGKISEFGDFRQISSSRRRTVLLSDDGFIEGFPGKMFEILMISEKSDLKENLKALNAGKVFPRFQLEPEEYYSFKKAVEESLSGSEDLYLFEFGKKYLLAVRL